MAFEKTGVYSVNHLYEICLSLIYKRISLIHDNIWIEMTFWCLLEQSNKQKEKQRKRKRKRTTEHKKEEKKETLYTYTTTGAHAITIEI